jgi:gamma-glutamylcyclotransferase (GGCT)/AIG2-like uncharacterized protein YtfP
MINKQVFCYGIFYEPEIIKALLGRVPKFITGELRGYDFFQGFTKDLTPEAKQIIEKECNLDEYSFLFLKKTNHTNAVVEGKLYKIDEKDELLLDSYELYPLFYRKQTVSIVDEHNQKHKGYIYTQDIEGVPYSNAYKRVVNNIDEVKVNVAQYRKRIIKQYSNFF